MQVNQPGDAFEKEADRVADRVVNQRTAENLVQSKEEDCVQCLDEKEKEEKVQKQAEEEEPVQMQTEEEEEKIQTKSEASDAGSVKPEIAQNINNSKGGGESLSPGVRPELETAIGADFSGVKIHRDKNAAELNDAIGAQAFTTGEDIYFNEGKYRPETSTGKHLLAHELTHVVQQNAGLKQPDIQKQPAPPPTWADKVKSAHDKIAAGKISAAEAEFLNLFKEAVPDSGFEKINIVQGSEKTPAVLKPGLNLDVTKTDHAGNAGFLLPDGTYTAKLPVTINQTPPPSVIVLGRHAFMRASPLNTLATFIHEKTHFLHQQTSVEILKKWRKSLSDKDKKRLLEKGEGSEMMKNEFIGWIQNLAVKKKLPTPDYAMAINSADGAGHTGNTEILSALEGFMGTFHLTDPANPPAFLMSELTHYPLDTGYWKGAPESIKTYYLDRLFDYYCHKISEAHRLAFDVFIAGKKSSQKDPSDFLDALGGFKSKKCKKPKGKN